MKRALLLLATAILCLTAAAAVAAPPLVKGGAVFDKTPAARPDPQILRTDILNQGFETAVPPAGWAVINGCGDPSLTWHRYAIAHGGSYSAGVLYGPSGVMQNEWLVTPALDLSSFSMVLMDFFEDEDYWDYYGLYHRIAVSTTSQTDPAAFTNIVTWTPATHTINGFGGDPVTVDLSAYAGESQVYVAFVYQGDWADNWFVDDVRLYEPFDHDVAAVSIAPDDMSWMGGATITPAGVVQNVGKNAESFDVRLTIARSGTPIYDETVAVTGLAPFATAPVTFPAAVLAPGNYYELTMTTLLAGDMAPANDAAGAMDYTYTGSRTPFGLLVTNWDCGPCAQANQALDAYTSSSGNSFALMRVHCWWPGDDDPMFLANIDQCTSLIEGTPTGSDYAPHLWLDGDFDASSDGSGYAGLIDGRRLVGSPLTVEVGVDQATMRLQGYITVNEPLPPGDYRVRFGVTEDGIHMMGSNGEPTHNQAFRWMYPDVDSVPLDVTPGVHEYWVDAPLDPSWIYDNLRAVVYVQNMDNLKVWNAGTVLIHQGTIPVFLADFSAVPAPGRVDIGFSVNGEAAGSFELLATNGTDLWSVPVEVRAGAFGAVDRAPQLAAGGEVVYSLYHVADGGRVLLTQQRVDLGDVVALRTALDGAFPNPFNPQTDIRFTVGKAQTLRLAVYDMTGRLVRELAHREFAAGEQTVHWDGLDGHGRGVASGTYMLRLDGRDVLQTRKVMLVR